MPLMASLMMKSWNGWDGGTSRKSTICRTAVVGDAQPLLDVSTTDSVMRVPGAPASYVIDDVPWPPVIVHPEHVHAYVLPALSVTEAVTPVEPTVTDCG